MEKFTALRTLFVIYLEGDFYMHVIHCASYQYYLIQNIRNLVAINNVVRNVIGTLLHRVVELGTKQIYFPLRKNKCAVVRSKVFRFSVMKHRVTENTNGNVYWYLSRDTHNGCAITCTKITPINVVANNQAKLLFGYIILHIQKYCSNHNLLHHSSYLYRRSMMVSSLISQ